MLNNKFRQQNRKLGLGQSYQMDVPSNQAPENVIGSVGRKGEKKILYSVYLQEKGHELQTKARFLIFKFNIKYFMSHPRKHAKPVPLLSKGALLGSSLSCEHSYPAITQDSTRNKRQNFKHCPPQRILKQAVEQSAFRVPLQFPSW